VSSDKRTVLPTKLPTALDHELNQPKQEARIYSPGADDPAEHHAKATEGAHISEKVYLFPEAFNALRKELHENWPQLWSLVGYPMAFDAPTFIELMDAALDTKTTFDTHKVQATCEKYLDLLRMKRGLKPLHATAAWSGIESAGRIVDSEGKPL